MAQGGVTIFQLDSKKGLMAQDSFFPLSAILCNIVQEVDRIVLLT